MEDEPAGPPRQKASHRNDGGDLAATTVAFFLCSSLDEPQDGDPRSAKVSVFHDERDDKEYDSDVSDWTETDMANLTIGDLCAESHARFQMEQLANLPPMFAVEPVAPARGAVTAPPSDDNDEGLLGLPSPSFSRESALARGVTTIEEGAQTPTRPATTNRKPSTPECHLLVPVQWHVPPPVAAPSTDGGGWGAKPLPPASKASAQPTTMAMEGSTQLDVSAPGAQGRFYFAPPGCGAECGGGLIDVFAAFASGATGCIECGNEETDGDAASVADERAARSLQNTRLNAPRWVL